MKKTVVFDMHLTIYKFLPGIQNKLKKNPQSIEAMPGAIETFMSFYQQGYKIAIISTSIIQHSRDRLEYLLAQHQVSSGDRKKIFQSIDILSMQYFGSKHSVEAWKRAMQSYENIMYIFEDGENKLKAAGEAAKSLGHNPELYTSIAEYLKES